MGRFPVVGRRRKGRRRHHRRKRVGGRVVGSERMVVVVAGARRRRRCGGSCGGGHMGTPLMIVELSFVFSLLYLSLGEIVCDLGNGNVMMIVNGGF